MLGKGSDFVKTLLGDLLALEVTTIIKDDVDSGKMPSVRRVALSEIAEEFRDVLIEYGVAYKAKEEIQTFPAGENPPFLLRWNFGGEFSFVEIKDAARFGQGFLKKKHEKETDPAKKEELENQLNMMIRLQTLTSGIIGMFKVLRKEKFKDVEGEAIGFAQQAIIGPEVKDHQPYPSQIQSSGWNNDLSYEDINAVDDLDLSPDQISLIRKTWELGSQKIYLQTVIQIDGDITSYITKDFINLPDNIKSIVLNIHNDSIGSSTKIWSMLFNMVTSMAEKFVSRGKNKAK
jgi:hypothetical protein